MDSGDDVKHIDVDGQDKSPEARAPKRKLEEGEEADALKDVVDILKSKPCIAGAHATGLVPMEKLAMQRSLDTKMPRIDSSDDVKAWKPTISPLAVTPTKEQEEEEKKEALGAGRAEKRTQESWDAVRMFLGTGGANVAKMVAMMEEMALKDALFQDCIGQ